jgi:hypothetical protein
MRTLEISGSTYQKERKDKTMWLDGYKSTSVNTTYLIFFFVIYTSPRVQNLAITMPKIYMKVN